MRASNVAAGSGLAVPKEYGVTNIRQVKVPLAGAVNTDPPEPESPTAKSIRRRAPVVYGDSKHTVSLKAPSELSAAEVGST